MKIEEINSLKEQKDYKAKADWQDYWFPLSKGYNRILIVLAGCIIIYTVYEYPEKVNTFFCTLLIEVITYMVIIWVYRGFKELPKK